MYHVSIYFDEKTEERLSQIIESVAKRSGNTFMTDNGVPPHITVCAFQCDDVTFESVKEGLDKVCLTTKAGEIYFAGVGQFTPDVMYVTPVLNEYLHGLTTAFNEAVNEALKDTIKDTIKETVNAAYDMEALLRVSKYYRPFQWLPHVTVAKTLDKEQMLAAFEVMQNTWGAFSGKVIKIGLAKTNPYRSIKLWTLES